MEIIQDSGEQTVRGASHYDITLRNDVVRDADCDITMGNDITMDIHCDVKMSNDFPMCIYHGITIYIMTLLWNYFIM